MAKIFVGNLHFDATESDVIGFFAEHSIGASEVKIIRDRTTGAGKGFAFVEVPEPDGQRAVQLNGGVLLERALRIAFAHPPNNGARR